MQDLIGKVALVTGGSKGVGKAIVRALAARGAQVVLNYFHSHDEAKRTRDELVATGARVDLARASVARTEQVDRMFADLAERHGRLDILVNNAANGALLPLDEITDEDIDKAINTNYKGGLRCARAAAPLMARNGGGAIVTVSALGGSQMVMANYSACAPAKAAAEAATRYLAVELAPLGIRVNTASAAMLTSEVAEKFPRAREMREVIERATPFGRLGTPEEFADVVAFLASDASRWITGQVVLADGGLSLGAALMSPPRGEPPAEDRVPAKPMREALPAEELPVEAALRRTPAPPRPASQGPASQRPVPQRPAPPVERLAEATDDAIAVVGMGLMVAGANSPEEFWKLRTTGDELFVRVPAARWAYQNFHSPDTTAEDKSYADHCVFITDMDPVPGSVDSMETPADGAGSGAEHELTTMWLRHSLVQALDGVSRRDTDRCSFVMGYTPDGSQHLEEAGVLESVTRVTGDILDRMPLADGERASLRTDIGAALAERYWRAASGRSRFLPHRVGELAMRGLLPPTTELHMVDTACSSSLYAIDIAAKGLLMGKQDIAVCGGAFALAPRGTVLFSKLQGLSKQGRVHALDEDADGVIFADGAALVVLKRLSRAEADGDRILGVLRAFGSSSDGKGKAIYAPNADGQSLAVRRALEDGEVDSRDVQWVNAHATGTPAGDLAEFTTLRAFYGTGGPAAVTSNKSLIGHTGWAAGVVSLIETLLGLEADTVPGQFRFSKPREEFELSATGLEIPPEHRKWHAPADDRPRHAAVSGFGFGGTNAHLIVSENRPGTVVTKVPDTGSRVAVVGWAAHLPGFAGREDVTRWLRGEGPRPKTTFGDIYPAPPFNKVRLPPKTIRALDRCQLMILECAHQLRDLMPDFWQEQTHKTGVFVGHMGPTRAAMLYANRCYLDDIEQALAGVVSPAVPQLIDALRERVRAMIPPSNEDSFPGQMPNIISARVANNFDLHGPNMTLDSGFASALSSLTSAARYLRTGELDFALAGGINGNSLPEYRALIGELLPAQAPDLAEGAFLFALTTEERARAAGLRVLGYVDEPLEGERAEEETEFCGAPAPERARYLGAAGGLAVLEALHRPAGTVVSVTTDSGVGGMRLRLAIPPHGPADSAPSAEPATRALPDASPADRGLPDGSRPRVRRYVPRLTEMAARPVRERTPFLPPGAVVVTDAPDLAARVAGAGETGITVLSTVPLPPGAEDARPGRPGWHHLARVTPEAVREALQDAGPALRHVRVVSDLGRSAPPGRALGVPTPSLTALHDATYLVLQHAYDDLADPAASFVAVLLGAVDGGTPHPYTGLFSGLLKTAALERADCLAYGLFTSGTDIAAAVARAEEESAAERRFPVVFEIDGSRRTYVLSDEPGDLRESGTRAVLGRDSVVVVAGGARGITAEVVKAVAEHFGPRLYVLGSNPLDDYPPEVFAGSDEQFSSGRSRYIKEALAARDGRTVAEINRAFDRLVHARDARRNLGVMEAHCGPGRVTYLTCDTRDADAVERAAQRILDEQGRIDLLVNAAGVQRSGLIKDKSFAEFTAIRDLKVDSYLNFKRALGAAPPRMWCNFGSLLGYFGQLGEADYASGNDFLATAATYAEARNGTTGGGTEEFTIGWTLWEGVGMGANELTKAYYERAASYSSMSVPEGVRHFLAELHTSLRRPSVVHLGEAERSTVERFYPGYLDCHPGCPEDAPEPNFFLRRLVSRDEASAVFECRFDLRTDGYLEHHTVRGEPTLPGTFVTEMAAEAARYLVPGKRVIAFEDLRFEHFLRVYRDVPTGPKRIRAEIVDAPGDATVVQVRITEDVRAPGGKLLVKDRVHFLARVLLDDTSPAAPRWEAWESGADTPVPDPYHAPGSPVRLTGPFVSTADTRVHPRGKRARYAPDIPAGDPVWSRFTVPCILLDGLARVGVLDLVDGHLVPVAAPLSIRRIDLYEDTSDHALAASGETIDLYATPPGFALAEDEASNRFVAARPDGRMVLQIKDLRAALIGYIDTGTGAAVPVEGR